MTPAEWLTIAGVGSSLIVAGVALRKSGPEGRSLDASAGAQIGNTGLAMAAADRDELAKLRAEMNAMRHREIARDHGLIRHAGWDTRMLDKMREALPGVQFEDPPPLFLPGTH